MEVKERSVVIGCNKCEGEGTHLIGGEGVTVHLYSLMQTDFSQNWINICQKVQFEVTTSD